MRIMGVDYGSKRIGLAISDENMVLAFPYQILENKKDIIASISSILKDREISEVVIGESVNLSGEPNKIMKDILVFKEKIEKTFKIPVFFEKEFFTSVEARRIQGSQKAVDDSSASLILQRYLDRKNNLN